MALTISQQPQLITPAFNDQYIVALSDQITSDGFKYKVEITIDAETTTKLINPRPDGYMVFNLKETVKNYIERSYLDLDSTTVKDATYKSVAVSVVISEYGVSPFDSETINYKAWDACYKEDDFIEFLYTDIINGASTSLLGTNILEATFPDNRVTLDTDIWIHFYNNNADKLQLRVYNDLSVLQNTIDITISSTDEKINYANIGRKIMLSQSPPITPQVGWYVEFEIISGVNSMFESAYTFTNICSKYDINRLYYLKRNGNIGFFNFELISEKKATKKNSYAKLNSKKLVDGIYGGNSWDREENVISTQINYKISLTSNWITQEQSNALDELWDSPIVWLHDGITYKSVKITDNDYTYKKHQNEKLFNYIINCEYSTLENRQRGL